MSTPVVLTRETRYGDNEASYYVSERAELVCRKQALALCIYSESVCEGLHNISGVFIGGEPSECIPVMTDTKSARVKAVVDEWIADGWTLVVGVENV